MDPEARMNSDSTLPPVDPHGNTGGCRQLWIRRLHWIVAGNPFYPLSAVLVLLGVFLLSGDDRLFSTEAGQLYFNFGTLQMYGFLIATTAVFLFRRAIYYDTLMLVVLAGLPILVPFILISQGAFLGTSTLTVLCVLAATSGVAQFALIRRGIRELPFSTGLPLLLGAVLLINLALPILLKEVHARLTAIEWAVQQDRHWHLGWTLLLPLLALGAFALPRPAASRFGDCRAGWLTSGFTGLLLAGTAVHFASLGYVYSFPWRNDFAHPTGWLFAWSVWWRRDEWIAGYDRRIALIAFALPALAGVLAMFQTGSTVLFCLNFVNLIIYAACAYGRFQPRLASALVLVSLAGLVLSLRPASIQALPAIETRGELLLLLFSCIGLLIAWFVRQPSGALIAALCTLTAVQSLWLDKPGDWPLVSQLALVVWWIHSLTWRDRHSRLPRTMQQLAFSVWLLHSLAWWAHSEAAGKIPMPWIALFMTATAGWLSYARRSWTFGILGGLALCLAGLPGADDAVAIGRRLPSGLWVMAIGLACFAGGTAAALLKKNWQPK